MITPKLDLHPLVRTAGKADLPQILQLYTQPTIDDGCLLPLPEAEDIFKRMLSYPDYRPYVAELDAHVVGTFALLVMENLGHMGAPSGIVEGVAVAPEYHGQGIGRAMMIYAMDHCRKRGCYKLALSANLTREGAHAFYEKLGFERHGYSFRITFAASPK